MPLAVALEGFAEFGVVTASVIKVYGVCRGRVSATARLGQPVSQWPGLPSDGFVVG